MDEARADRKRRDRKLSVRLSEGDMEALEAVYDTYSGPLFRLSYALLHSEADAEDTLQTVFLKLARRRGGPVKDLNAYLFTSVRNESYSILRNRRRMTFTEEAEPYAVPSESRAGHERSVEVEEALKSLPADQREAVVLHIYGQMTFEEIGRCVKASGPTVASRYRYALKKLRLLLGEKTHAR